MVRSSGMHRSSRDRLTKKISNGEAIRRALQSFEINDKVVIVPNPTIQRNIPHHRFFGMAGKVIDKKGRAYTIEIKQGDKTKYLNVLPAHLKRL